VSGVSVHKRSWEGLQGHRDEQATSGTDSSNASDRSDGGCGWKEERNHYFLSLSLLNFLGPETAKRRNVRRERFQDLKPHSQNPIFLSFDVYRKTPEYSEKRTRVFFGCKN
jgi:hypothetical protein